MATAKLTASSHFIMQFLWPFCVESGTFCRLKASIRRVSRNFLTVLFDDLVSEFFIDDQMWMIAARSQDGSETMLRNRMKSFQSFMEKVLSLTCGNVDNVGHEKLHLVRDFYMEKNVFAQIITVFSFFCTNNNVFSHYFLFTSTVLGKYACGSGQRHRYSQGCHTAFAIFATNEKGWIGHQCENEKSRNHNQRWWCGCTGEFCLDSWSIHSSFFMIINHIFTFHCRSQEEPLFCINFHCTTFLTVPTKRVSRNFSGIYHKPPIPCILLIFFLSFFAPWISFIAKTSNSNVPNGESNGHGTAAEETHECFVFISSKLASDITLTIGQAFELAYRCVEH